MFDSPITAKIVEELTTGSKNSAILVAKVAKSQNCSIQSVYAALRKLREQSVVLLHKKVLMLNVVWIEEQSELLQRAQATYFESSDSGSFSVGTLEEGDRVTYQFKNPILLDEMWGHAFLLLLEKAHKKVPIMIYNAHSWFPIVRHASEKTIFSTLANQGYKAYFSIGGTTDLDRSICKDFIHPIGHSFSLGNQFGLRNNQYLNIIDDYLIEVSLDTRVSNNIDDFYKKYVTLTSANQGELQEIVSAKGSNKLIISRNSRKALLWRSRLSKDFLIPTASRQYV